MHHHSLAGQTTLSKDVDNFACSARWLADRGNHRARQKSVSRDVLGLVVKTAWMAWWKQILMRSAEMTEDDKSNFFLRFGFGFCCLNIYTSAKRQVLVSSSTSCSLGFSFHPMYRSGRNRLWLLVESERVFS